jgi:Mg2+/citrate symporter
MALTNPFSDTVETPQTRTDQPFKFWGNVVVAVVLMPLAIAGLFLSGSILMKALNIQG